MKMNENCEFLLMHYIREDNERVNYNEMLPDLCNCWQKIKIYDSSWQSHLKMVGGWDCSSYESQNGMKTFFLFLDVHILCICCMYVVRIVNVKVIDTDSKAYVHFL